VDAAMKRVISNVSRFDVWNTHTRHRAINKNSQITIREGTEKTYTTKLTATEVASQDFQNCREKAVTYY